MSFISLSGSSAVRSRLALQVATRFAFPQQSGHTKYPSYKPDGTATKTSYLQTSSSRAAALNSCRVFSNFGTSPSRTAFFKISGSDYRESGGKFVHASVSRTMTVRQKRFCKPKRHHFPDHMQTGQIQRRITAQQR